MNHSFKALLAITLAYFVCSNAWAVANLNDVTVDLININKTLGNQIFIRTSTPPTVVGCQEDSNWNLVLDAKSELDDKIFSMLLAAHAAGTKVNITGTGTCSAQGIEYLQSITTKK